MCIYALKRGLGMVDVYSATACYGIYLTNEVMRVYIQYDVRVVYSCDSRLGHRLILPGVRS